MNNKLYLALIATILSFVSVIKCASSSAASGLAAVDPTKALIYYNLKNIQDAYDQTRQLLNLDAANCPAETIQRLNTIFYESSGSLGPEFYTHYANMPSHESKPNNFLQEYLDLCLPKLIAKALARKPHKDPILEHLHQAVSAKLKSTGYTTAITRKILCIIRTIQLETNLPLNIPEASAAIANANQQAHVAIQEKLNVFKLIEPNADLDHIFSNFVMPTDDIFEEMLRKKLDKLKKAKVKSCTAA